METSEALEVLGLPPDATRAQIKEAYRDLSKVWHPDRFGSDPRLRAKAEDTLKHINQAYQFLQDPTARFTSGPSRASAPDAVPPTAPPPVASDDHRSRWQTRLWAYVAIVLVSMPLFGLFLARLETKREPAAAAHTEEPQSQPDVRASMQPAALEKPRAVARAPQPAEPPQVAGGPKMWTVDVPETTPDAPEPQAPSQPVVSSPASASAGPKPDPYADSSLAAKNPQQAFIKRWEGQAVVVRTPLYSLLFSERGKLGNTRRGMREGLVVITPSQGMYLQFDGRQGRDDVVERDPNRIVRVVNAAYQPDSLDVRSYRKVEPQSVTRYDPGVEFIVRDVRIDRDQVRLRLADVGAQGDDTVTSVRVRWPMPLSKAFTERGLVDELVRRFVDLQTP